MKVIGLMSGTSVDGIDAALVDISDNGDKPDIKLIEFETYPYPEGMRERIIALSSTGRIDQVCHLNFYLGELFAEAAIGIAKKGGYDLSDIEIIGSHGQTIFHQPDYREELHYKIRSTLQIGEPSIIAERTGITTVADFRPRDIAAGGEGAPLTPYLHYHLFKDRLLSRLIINIGGISNITYMPAGTDMSEIIAFDTGPGNMLIDGLVEVLFNEKLKMDINGEIAERGSIIEPLLSEFLEDPFVNKTPPKTTGREVYGLNLIKDIQKKVNTLNISVEDLIATITAFTSRSISLNCKRFILPEGEVSEAIIGGGGTKNNMLMKMLKSDLKPIPVRKFEDYRLSDKAIEAMAFALLAYGTIHGIPNNIPSATGAKNEVIMGKIIPGKGIGWG
ncbi:MAG: anhydro-N-acetylmuramic acid kinase [Nitrospirota bacterium]